VVRTDEILQQLIDERAIQQCLVRISRGSDRFDKDLFLTAFHEDAVISTGAFVGDPEDLYDWSAAFQRKMYNAVFHKFMNQSFDIVGDTAHVETYYLFVGCMKEQNLLAGGRYVDRFERRDGVWAIVMRNNFIEWTSPAAAIPSPVGAGGDLALNGLPAWDRSDPSYIRPLINRRARNFPLEG
jgi:hypothetical protein